MSTLLCFIFFFKQKTAYEMRISDWSSDVCSSDLAAIGWSAMLIQARVIFPWGPTASANAVMGIRHRCSGLRNHGRHMPRADRSLSSRALLTGLGLFGLPVR